MLARVLALANSGVVFTVVATPVWHTCPVYTEGTDENLRALGCRRVPHNTTASCAYFNVPLDYSGAKSEQHIDIFVKRIRAIAQPVLGELWLLNGGPGMGGAEIECLVADFLNTTRGSFDIVIPDHRGVGRSTPLECGNITEHHSVECLREAVKLYGPDYLNSFTVSNAAKDLHAVIEQERVHQSADHARMFYSVSYGTYWLQRYLQFYPNEPNAVVLDGVCAPDLLREEYADFGTSASGAVFLAECGQDEVCAKNLGSQPIYSLHLLYGLIRSGQLDACTHLIGIQPLTTTVLQEQLAYMLMDTNKRLMIGPFINRMVRCDAADVIELRYFFNKSFAEQERTKSSNRFWLDLHLRRRLDRNTSSSVLSNFLLAFNILMSELRVFAHSPHSLQQMIAAEGLLDFAADHAHPDDVLLRESSWPIYRPDPQVAAKYPSTTIPMLIMTGTLDPQTSMDHFLRVKQFYRAPRQLAVAVPYAVHATVYPGHSAVKQDFPDSAWSHLDCGMQMAGSFFLSQGAVVDSKCLSRLVVPDFAGARSATKEIARKWFGTGDLWGDDRVNSQNGRINYL